MVYIRDEKKSIFSSIRVHSIVLTTIRHKLHNNVLLIKNAALFWALRCRKKIVWPGKNLLLSIKINCTYFYMPPQNIKFMNENSIPLRTEKERFSLSGNSPKKYLLLSRKKKTGKNFKVVVVTANYYRALIYETSWSTLSDRLEKRRNLFQWLVRSYVVRRQHHHYYYTSSLCRLPKNLPQPF